MFAAATAAAAAVETGTSGHGCRYCSYTQQVSAVYDEPWTSMVLVYRGPNKT